MQSARSAPNHPVLLLPHYEDHYPQVSTSSSTRSTLRNSTVGKVTLLADVSCSDPSMGYKAARCSLKHITLDAQT
jgi:hypothetical protein